MAQVVNPNRQDIYQQEQRQDQATQNLQSVLQALNQRRHEVERQQREMEYNVMNKYAAEHGGWANILTQPGGEDMFEHYATNVLGYDQQTLDPAKQAIKQGYNPDEALYRINRELMFSGGRGAPQTKGQEQQQQSGQFSDDAIMGIVADQGQGRGAGDQATQEQGRETQPQRSPSQVTTQQDTNTISEQLREGNIPLSEEEAARKADTTQGRLEWDQNQGRWVQREQEARGVSEGAETRAQAQQEQLEEEGVPTRQDEEVSSDVVQDVNKFTELSNKQIEGLTADTLRNKRSLFPDGKIPFYSKDQARAQGYDPSNVDIMSDRQRKAYDQMKEYYATLRTNNPDEVIAGAKKVFGTIGSNQKNPSKGTQKASSKQFEQRSKKVARNLQAPETLAEFTRMSKDEVQRFRQQIDLMQQNNPQRWAETYGDALEAAKGLSDKRYKDALAAGQLIKNGINRLKLKMQQQATQGDQQAAQMQTALKVMEMFMKNPELAKRDEYKDAAEAVGALANNLIAPMVGAAKGTGAANILKRLKTEQNWWKFWGDANLESVYANPTASSGQRVSDEQISQFIQYANNQ